MKIKNNSISRDPFYSIFVLPGIVNLWFNGKDLTSVGNIVMPTPSALRIGKPSKRYRANSSHLRQQRYIDNSVSRNDNFDKFTLFRDERSEDKLSLSCTFVDFFFNLNRTLVHLYRLCVKLQGSYIFVQTLKLRSRHN